MATPIRIGTLGAATITPKALIQPAELLESIEVCAVAARDPARARSFARRHGIPTVHETYDALMEDPTLDAIYVPLPNSLHHAWTLRALRAGKHVLCEKPLAANAAEAQEMQGVARKTELILVEAFHNLYHPLICEVKSVIDSGELGRIEHVEAHFNMPIPKFKDIRLEYDLAGGAAMDVGCYPVALLRYLLNQEPEVTQAKATVTHPQIDQHMRVQLNFPEDITAEVSCSLFVPWRANVSMRIRGSDGYIWVLNPWLPHYFNWLTIRTPQKRISRWVRAERTYLYQLKAFVEAVNGEEEMFTDGEFGTKNMAVIDAIYQAAGLKIRGTSHN